MADYPTYVPWDDPYAEDQPDPYKDWQPIGPFVAPEWQPNDAGDSGAGQDMQAGGPGLDTMEVTGYNQAYPGWRPSIWDQATGALSNNVTQQVGQLNELARRNIPGYAGLGDAVGDLGENTGFRAPEFKPLSQTADDAEQSWRDFMAMFPDTSKETPLNEIVPPVPASTLDNLSSYQPIPEPERLPHIPISIDPYFNRFGGTEQGPARQAKGGIVGSIGQAGQLVVDQSPNAIAWINGVARTSNDGQDGGSGKTWLDYGAQQSLGLRSNDPDDQQRNWDPDWLQRFREAHSGFDPTEQDWRDYLLSTRHSGTGPNGTWTDDDWRTYSSVRQTVGEDLLYWVGRGGDNGNSINSSVVSSIMTAFPSITPDRLERGDVSIMNGPDGTVVVLVPTDILPSIAGKGGVKGITLGNVIILGPNARDYPTLMHEYVHALQYRKLGIGFLDAYMKSGGFWNWKGNTMEEPGIKVEDTYRNKGSWLPPLWEYPWTGVSPIWRAAVVA